MNASQNKAAPKLCRYLKCLRITKEYYSRVFFCISVFAILVWKPEIRAGRVINIIDYMNETDLTLVNRKALS